MGKNKNKNKGNGGVQTASTPAVATPTTLTIVVDSEAEKKQLQEYIAMADQYSLSKREEADQYYATKKEEADALRGQAEAEIERRVAEAIAQERKRMKQEIADAEAEAKEIIKKANADAASLVEQLEERRKELSKTANFQNHIPAADLTDLFRLLLRHFQPDTLKRRFRIHHFLMEEAVKISQHRSPILLACFNAFQKPSHIFSETAHHLKPLQIFLYLRRVLTVHHIPVLSGDDGHGGNGEIFVQYVEGSAGTSSSAGKDGASRLTRKLFGG